MRIVLVVCFLNEQGFLPTVLRSLAGQRRLPDELVLVDDGSTDRSHEIAREFAAGHAYATVLRRPPRPPERDRLAMAGELKAFQWAMAKVDPDWDVAGKIDADIEMPPDWLETMERRFLDRPHLGLAGTQLSVPGANGVPVREPSPPYHTRGATKLYRRACYEAIGPVPPILGWDMIDDVRVRMAGWDNEVVEVPSGDPVQLRPTGRHDGRLRASARWGECAWGYGSHPLVVALSAVMRVFRGRPVVLAGLAYLYGWLKAALGRRPRAERAVRDFLRREQWSRLPGQIRRGAAA